MKKHLLGLVVLTCFGVSACQTTPKPIPPVSEPPISEPIPSPEPVTPPVDGGGSNQVPPVTQPPNIEPPISVPPVVTTPNPNFASVNGWDTADMRAALKSFQRSCLKLKAMEPDQYLSEGHPKFGRVSDWLSSCALGEITPTYDANTSRQFFENEFLPVKLTGNVKTGIVTGYYQPEIKVRRVKDETYSEPILSVPTNKSVLSWPRSKISELAASPIAYGKPMEVFFMQIQGSGVLGFENGEKIRAAYAANNGYPYTSIGRLLIERGELSKDQASKQDIEQWMSLAGPQKSKALMNENKRYIFFKPETILPGEGPKGAQQVPLTEMASIAVDPSHYPYGLPVWLETKTPSGKGDYIGQDTNLLVISQDTGKAIRGAFRADLYFGSGFFAGDKAGVMKHPASWTLLLPFHLALQLASIS